MICSICRLDKPHVTPIKAGGAICDDCLRDGCLTPQERRAKEAGERRVANEASRQAHREAVQRGKATEDLIEDAAEALALQKKAWIHKLPTNWRPIGGGRQVPATKSLVDFIGFDREGCFIAIEAKRCPDRDKRLYLTAVKDHQRAYLDLVDANHGRAYLLADFPEAGDWYCVPWRVARDLVSVDPADAAMWAWKFLRGTLVI